MFAHWTYFERCPRNGTCMQSRESLESMRKTDLDSRAHLQARDMLLLCAFLAEKRCGPLNLARNLRGRRATSVHATKVNWQLSPAAYSRVYQDLRNYLRLQHDAMYRLEHILGFERCGLIHRSSMCMVASQAMPIRSRNLTIEICCTLVN